MFWGEILFSAQQLPFTPTSSNADVWFQHLISTDLPFPCDIHYLLTPGWTLPKTLCNKRWSITSSINGLKWFTLLVSKVGVVRAAGDPGTYRQPVGRTGGKGKPEQRGPSYTKVLGLRRGIWCSDTLPLCPQGPPKLTQNKSCFVAHVNFVTK